MVLNIVYVSNLLCLHMDNDKRVRGQAGDAFFKDHFNIPG
jgi:hypothetical protein